MTLSLIVFVPVALLILISSLCFVGCVLDTTGLGLGFTTYSDSDVIANPSCVAYWPLSDSPGQDTALDVVGKANGDPHNGTYRSVANSDPMVKALFPCPDFDLGIGLHSDFAPGTLTIGAPGIVAGDTLPPHDPKNATSTTCMQADGGFVTVPANSVVNPMQFSIEAWVRPEWDAAAPPAVHVFIDSRGVVGDVVHGYVLTVNQAGSWEAALSVAGGVTTVLVTGGPATLSVATHVVLTFDGGNAALWTDGTQASPLTPLPVGSTFTPNTTSPLVIGVGLPWKLPRKNPSDKLFFPLLPFKGKIQDVAIYNAVLSGDTIKNHAEHGKGNSTG